MEKKSTIIMGISIIIGFIILGGSIIYTFEDSAQTAVVNTNRYEMITPNDSNIIIFDKQAGRYWRKYIDPNEGPTEWTEETLYFLNK